MHVPVSSSSISLCYLQKSDDRRNAKSYLARSVAAAGVFVREDVRRW